MNKPYEDKCYEISEEFNSSCLGGHSFLYHNHVGIHVMRDSNGSFDCVNEFIGEMQELIDIMPYSAKLILSGIRFEIQTTDGMTKELINIMNERWFVESTSVPSLYGRDQTYTTTIHMQTPDWHSDDYFEFMRTYYKFLTAKYNQREKEINKRND